MTHSMKTVPNSMSNFSNNILALYGGSVVIKSIVHCFIIVFRGSIGIDELDLEKFSIWNTHNRSLMGMMGVTWDFSWL